MEEQLSTGWPEVADSTGSFKLFICITTLTVIFRNVSTRLELNGRADHSHLRSVAFLSSIELELSDNLRGEEDPC